MANYDILGNIAIVKFERSFSLKEKKKYAEDILKNCKSVRTVLEKTGKFKGRLRTLTTKWIAGEKTKEVLYKENGCIFRFNADHCYFSPRLASERLEIAKMIKKNEEVLFLFGGVAPFSIIAAKLANPRRAISIELSRECSKYALENARRNKVNVEVIQGNVRKILPKMHKKFDRIVMARPNLEDSFLDVSLKRIKNGGIIHYYGFYNENESKNLKDLIFREAKKAKKKIKILRMKKAGDIGMKRYRYRLDFKVLS